MNKQRKMCILFAAVLLAAASGLAGCGQSGKEDPAGTSSGSVSGKEDPAGPSSGTASGKEDPAETSSGTAQKDPGAPAGTELKEDLDADDGWFVWDLNGDGVPEEFSVDHIKNGDEAADVGIITRTDDGSEAYIDRFYGIEEITGGEDENGRHLVIIYSTGDFSEHSTGAKCILRDINGELDIRLVSDKEPGAFFDFMDDYMSQQLYKNFDGEYFPVSVTDAAMGEPAYEITDKEAIRTIFEALKKVQVGEQTDNVWLDGDRWLTFRFANGDKKIYLFYGDEQVYFENFVYELTDDGGLFKAIEAADRLESTTQSEGIGGGA